MTGRNKQRLQMPARGAESVTEDGVARPGVPMGGRECARRWLRAGWMDRIRLLWSLGSLTLWPIHSGGGASPGRNALPQARAFGGALLAGQTAQDGQGSGRSQGLTKLSLVMALAWQSWCLPTATCARTRQEALSSPSVRDGAQPNGPFDVFSPLPFLSSSRSGRDRRRKEVHRPIVFAVVPEILT